MKAIPVYGHPGGRKDTLEWAQIGILLETERKRQMVVVEKVGHSVTPLGLESVRDGENAFKVRGAACGHTGMRLRSAGASLRSDDRNRRTEPHTVNPW